MIPVYSHLSAKYFANIDFFLLTERKSDPDTILPPLLEIMSLLWIML